MKTPIKKYVEKIGDDISQYQRIVVALKETSRLIWEIDKAIRGWPIE